MLRAIALSLALLFAVGTIIPLATDSTEAGPRHHKKNKKKKKLKKYSKAWWRWHHKMKKKRKALAARKRALRARQMVLAKRKMAKRLQAKSSASNPRATFDKKGNAEKQTARSDDSASTLPSGKKAPKGWKKTQVTNSEQGFAINDEAGGQVGSASLTVVGLSMGEDSASSRTKTLGGVQSGTLRRSVIDRMMREEGWVVNDYFKDINGKRVYVVVGQSSKGNQVLSRYFYFTEIDGKIYNLATSAPSDNAERLARESERVINSLQRRTSPVQADLR